MSDVEAPEARAGAQQELSLAMVYGQAVIEMPQDLYIPRMHWRCFLMLLKARSTCCCT